MEKMFKQLPKKNVKNAAWLIGCKIVQVLLSFVIGTISARYLGPSNYGMIDYAGAIVSFMVPVVQLGFRATLTHEIISNPDREGEALGSALLLSTAASLLGVVGIFAFCSIANRSETDTIIVCVLYSVSLLFQATELIQYWFQSKLESKYVAVVSLCAYAVVSAYRCFLLITAKSVFWFAVTHALDYLLISLSLFVIYRRLHGQRLRFSPSLGWEMFRRSRYYIISGVMVTLFSLTDRVMINWMIGKEANGYYSAAFTCANLSQFVFAAIVDSARPSILEAKKNGSASYRSHLARLFSIVIALALAQGLALSLAARLVIGVIYGKAYLAAVPVLRIITWYSAFAYIGSVRNIWILAEQKQQILWKINLFGAVLNITANFFLIPRLGIAGAAIASVFAQFFVNFFLCFALRELREVSRILLDSLNPRTLRKLWLGDPKTDTSETQIGDDSNDE